MFNLGIHKEGASANIVTSKWEAWSMEDFLTFLQINL